MEAKERIIVALDFDDEKEALELAEKVAEFVWGFKVNYLYSKDPNIVETLKDLGSNVFVDMKIKDIPRSAVGHARAQIGHGADIINLHADGGIKMMKAVKEAAGQYEDVRVAAVTVLTSLSDDDCKDIYKTINAEEAVIRLALMAIEGASLDAVICSPNEVSTLRHIYSQDFLTITPGIRLIGDDNEDQKRVNTPYNAILNGSDMLVIGSSITKAKDPIVAVGKITKEIEKALEECDKDV